MKCKKLLLEMIAVFKKYKIMVLVSIFFFYLGCVITLGFLRIDCTDAVSSLHSNNIFLRKLEEVEYAVLVLSSPSNEPRRDAIRATWAQFSQNIFLENGEKLYRWNHSWTDQSQKLEIINVFFVIATQRLSGSKIDKLKTENQRTNDLLLIDNVEDSYNNLAIKVMYSLKWVNDGLPSLKYLIKCDDDSFVRVDLIVRIIEAYAPEMNAPELKQYVNYKTDLSMYKGLYWGYFTGKAKVYLNGKWQEREWFLCDRYLPYALGGGYVISKSIVDYIAKNIDFLSHYISEDVSMGVWTAALGNINRVHDIRFDTEWTSRGCNNHMLVRHKQSPSDMFQMYKSLVHSKGDRLCPIEDVKRRFYSYKWNLLPSMCC